MPRRVLRACAAQVRTDAAEHRGGKFLAVARHGQAAQHLDAIAMQQLGLQRLQVAGERRQREISRADLAQVAVQAEVMPCGMLQVRNLRSR